MSEEKLSLYKMERNQFTFSSFYLSDAQKLRKIEETRQNIETL